jgi:dTDP-4-dehydrorhamnose reductase
LAGEKAIERIYPDNSAIIRTSWVYSSHGNNFVKTMLRLMKEKDELNVVADQIGCPTYARGLAEFLWSLTKTDSVEAIYHWSDLGVASWYDFAVAIQGEGLKLGLLDREIPIHPIKSEQYPTPAKRPKFSLLSPTGQSKCYWTSNLSKALNLV